MDKKIILEGALLEIYQAALKSYIKRKFNPKAAVIKALKVVEETVIETQADYSKITLDPNYLIKEFERKLGKRVPDHFRYHVIEALNNGTSMERLIELNPELKE